MVYIVEGQPAARPERRWAMKNLKELVAEAKGFAGAFCKKNGKKSGLKAVVFCLKLDELLGQPEKSPAVAGWWPAGSPAA